MPIINTPIVFSAESEQLIATKIASPEFSHTNWGDDDLLPVRQELRNFYRTEQRLRCIYCQNPISAISVHGVHIEHIVPKSIYQQFLFTPKNLCLICPDCNHSKGQNEILPGFDTNPLNNINISQYPRSSDAFKIVHPYFDTYEDHIIKSNRIYVDRTPKGHWTIGLCKLNRFFHRFGVSDELVEDIQIIESEERFHESSSPYDTSITLEDLTTNSMDATLT